MDIEQYSTQPIRCYTRLSSDVTQVLRCCSAPSMWNSQTDNCRSAELLSTFRRNQKLSYLTLLTVNVNTRPSLCHLCAS